MGLCKASPSTTLGQESHYTPQLRSGDFTLVVTSCSLTTTNHMFRLRARLLVPPNLIHQQSRNSCLTRRDARRLTNACVINLTFTLSLHNKSIQVCNSSAWFCLIMWVSAPLHLKWLHAFRLTTHQTGRVSTLWTGLWTTAPATQVRRSRRSLTDSTTFGCHHRHRDCPIGRDAIGGRRLWTLARPRVRRLIRAQ